VNATRIAPAHGRLLVLTPGLGAVATTTIAGIELVRRRLAVPVGSLSQLGTARLGDRADGRVAPIRELVPLAAIEDLVFGAWDIHGEDAGAVARRARVLSAEHLGEVGDFLATVRPRAGCHDPARVRRLDAPHALPPGRHRAALASLRRDIAELRAEAGAERAVMILTTSTETHHDPGPVGADVRAFERALDEDDPRVSPTMLYAWAAILEGVPFANATPNVAVELPAFQELADRQGVPIAGRDLKSGQTMMKTVVAPALKARLLGLNGWFSTNILGNRDGEVLDDPAAFRSKEITKSSVLDTILQPEQYPALYADYSHKVAIHYYPPRGDEKEGWDNVDLFGWLGYPMQLKLNFLCRDSVLAAPLVLDLALFLDLAGRAGLHGPQPWLSFYFKSPLPDGALPPEHDLFIQLAQLKNRLRLLGGESPVTHVDHAAEEAVVVEVP
jgi:myo-inositol-1-phosphate synthase